MGHTYAVSGLVSKRSEMAGLIEYHQKEIERLRQGLYQIDAAIRIFDPAYRIRSIRTKEYDRRTVQGEPVKMIGSISHAAMVAR